MTTVTKCFVRASIHRHFNAYTGLYVDGKPQFELASLTPKGHKRTIFTFCNKEATRHGITAPLPEVKKCGYNNGPWVEATIIVGAEACC